MNTLTATLLVIDGRDTWLELLEKDRINIGRGGGEAGADPARGTVPAGAAPTGGAGQASARQTGMASEGSIALRSRLVAQNHGVLSFDGGNWFYQDHGSAYGTYINGRKLLPDEQVRLNDGSIIRIEKDGTVSGEGVLLFFILGHIEENYLKYSTGQISPDRDYYIGRSASNDIQFDTVSVSRRHGMIWLEDGSLNYRDLNSTNGSYINGSPVQGYTPFRPKDILLIGNIKMIHAGGYFIVSRPEAGSFIEIRNLTKTVEQPGTRQKKTILTDVTVTIPERNLVAILGGSGAGKTTFMNCVMGYEMPTGGTVSIDGMNHLQNKDALRRKIGYVPQDDLLRDNLSVERTLEYSARLRLTENIPKEELRERISTQLDYLGIAAEHRQKQIKKLSGGQRKRVSIANELVADPPIIFLDEPTSGLDPKTETDLIYLLKNLARDQGKTLIVVTHTIRNILLFDQILFFGRNGVLKFSGSPQSAMDHFGVDDFVDIYDIVNQQDHARSARTPM